MFLIPLYHRFFEFKNEDLNFFDAQSQCEDLGGRLAEPRNQEQFDFVVTFTERADLFWLGGTDILQDDLWLWNSDNSTIDLDRFWRNTEPNNLGGNERCLEIRSRQFNDIPCERTQPFVCEFAAIGDVPLCS